MDSPLVRILLIVVGLVAVGCLVALVSACVFLVNRWRDRRYS